MANIKDVAEKAGVTVTTVSRVMNNRGYISMETRNKVNEAIRELQYQPNEVARSLFRRRSNLFGLIIPNVAHPFFAELTSCIERVAYENGFKILLCNSLMDNQKERDYVDMLKRHQVDGIIMGSHTLEVEEYLDLNLPLVTIDRFIAPVIPYVASDNYAGGLLATYHLLERGATFLAHISGNLSLQMLSNQRCEAFLDVCKKQNIQHVVVETELNALSENTYDEQIKQLLQNHPKIDGIFASSDTIGVHIIKVCHELGKKVPDDVRIVAFDNIALSDITQPTLSTIRQPIEAMATAAVSCLADQIAGKNVSMKQILPVNLIVRASS